MIKWDPNKGWYDTNTGLALDSPERQESKRQYLESKNKFLEENMYDPNKDYSSDFGKLFGSDVNRASELYYSGPSPRWQGALSDRLRERMSRKKNVYGSGGRYEGSTETMDRDLQRQMYRRNNAIEDMFRKGYSMAQINAHTSGQRNVLEEGPDYKDYQKAVQGEGLFGAEPTNKDWYKDYFDVPVFIGQPPRGASGGSDTAARPGAPAASAPAASAPAGGVFINQPNRNPDMNAELFSQGGEAEGSDPYYNPEYQYVPAGVQDMIFGLFNPYASELMLTYGYQPPTDPVTGQPVGTPSLTDPGTYTPPGVGVGPSLPTGTYTPPGPTTPIDPGVDPTPPDYTPPEPPPDPTVPSDPDPGGGDPGGGGPDPTPTGPPSGYVGAASLKGIDELAHRKRNYLGGMDVLVGSRQEVSAEDFNRLLGTIEGKYGKGAFYDPARGSIYQNIDDDKVAIENSSYIPVGIDPTKYQEQQKTQAAMMGLGDQVDERGRRKRSREPIYTSQRIGDKMYFVDGGKIFSYDVRDKQYGSTPSFATGGAVSKVASTGVGTLFNGYF